MFIKEICHVIMYIHIYFVYKVKVVLVRSVL
jgi:hypothetical protein